MLLNETVQTGTMFRCLREKKKKKKRCNVHSSKRTTMWKNCEALPNHYANTRTLQFFFFFFSQIFINIIHIMYTYIYIYKNVCTLHRIYSYLYRFQYLLWYKYCRIRRKDEGTFSFSVFFVNREHPSNAQWLNLRIILY